MDSRAFKVLLLNRVVQNFIWDKSTGEVLGAGPVDVGNLEYRGDYQYEKSHRTV